MLKASPFLGEGHRKVKARLAAKGIRVGKNRVLRLMREHGLLVPVRRGHPRGDRTHSGRIPTERPDELWGTDASRFGTKAEGWCWLFAAVDHCTSDVLGWHVAKKGDRLSHSRGSSHGSPPPGASSRVRVGSLDGREQQGQAQQPTPTSLLRHPGCCGCPEDARSAVPVFTRFFLQASTTFRSTCSSDTWRSGKIPMMLDSGRLGLSA